MTTMAKREFRDRARLPGAPRPRAEDAYFTATELKVACWCGRESVSVPKELIGKRTYNCGKPRCRMIEEDEGYGLP